ncbi:carbohydrate ABC transporter permease [Paenibacillus sp. WQ 127069]|uniref:Carbohydrate ABC transporter permease n=1 Tax=Paenibacillus baimaensis TaxID=2982185 RepID=A0ABT2UEZ5_9BACL|nr:carbohydrate ABC transporter permease [Paenibacillus sp. WQ 127069]MCU6792581.1 carbohydrate ABC transporter permease [Paenibacillus sp. WQ 127069]
MNKRYNAADIFICTILLLSCIITILPVWHVFSVSFSGPDAVYHTSLMLYPKELTLQAYKYVFSTPTLIRAFGITVIITVAGTLINLLFTISGAYALSKRDLPGLNMFMVFLVLVMTFHAGIVPGYLNIKNLGLLNSLWAMMLPGAVNAFYLILMRNFFMDLPKEIEESAKIDGCNELSLIVKIVIPLSTPVIATIGLFYGVGHWNEFFKGVFYMSDSSKWPLQVLLKTIVFDQNFSDLASADTTNIRIEPANIQSAAIVFATVPILLVYPFLQKYFVKGIVMGAVKG